MTAFRRLPWSRVSGLVTGAAGAAAVAATTVQQRSTRRDENRVLWPQQVRGGQLLLRCQEPAPHRSAAASSPPSPNPATLMRWFEAHGGRRWRGLELVEVPGAGFGLQLANESKPCPAGTELLRTPRALILSENDEHEVETEGSAPLIPGEELPIASRRLRARLAAARLASIREAADGATEPGDKLGPWIASLQPPPSMPLLLLGDDADAPPPPELRGTIALMPAITLRLGLREEAAAAAEELRLAAKTAKKAAKMAKKAAKKGVAVAEADVQMPSMGPLASLTVTEDTAAVWEALVWAQAILMSRAVKLPKGGSQLMIVPMADFANHVCTHAEASAEFRIASDGSGDVVLAAKREVRPGEEIRICYGQLGNDQLLFAFGFCIKGNPIGGGPPCPVTPPTSPGRSALFRRGLQDLRHKTTDGTYALPQLCAPGRDKSVGADPVGELLWVFQVSALSEESADKLLLLTSNAGGGSLDFSGVGATELKEANRLLEKWDAELTAAVAARGGSPDEDLSNLTPAQWMQKQTLASVSAARGSILERLPYPWLPFPWANLVVEYRKWAADRTQ
eukprot:gnl/TRDRNA2_/TRDRNA2_135104_c0_seq2.p1 gnl/TRDRNA2_/TRDRNA2_135104_c0~~gnl/TRDRNA2_/TRDRNA2_135104_c0_seq2.p1  ORF type:complete len:567 (+),score=93.55 gnl/TRDRNA2_/TRDRNA2_135104_c0_seq2:54-1754(+)